MSRPTQEELNENYKTVELTQELLEHIKLFMIEQMASDGEWGQIGLAFINGVREARDSLADEYGSSAFRFTAADEYREAEIRFEFYYREKPRIIS